MAADCESESEPSIEVVRSRYARVFGVEQPTQDAVRLIKILSVLLPSFALSFQISTTFWMIYIAESLGNGDYFAGLTFVGLLVVLQLGIQTILDYPTGAIGDWIGQRYVISSALLCYAVVFYLSSMIVADTLLHALTIDVAPFSFNIFIAFAVNVRSSACDLLP